MLAITGQAHDDAPLRHRHVSYRAPVPGDAAQVTQAPIAGEPAGGIVELSRSSSNTRSTRRPGPVPNFPGPPYPENTRAPEEVSPFERFVAGSAAKARFSGQPPSPPNERGVVSEKALWLFLAAVGFFFVSLVLNLYSQVGMIRDKAMAADDDDAVVANRVGSMNPGRLGDGKAHGQVKWLQNNMAPAPISAV